MADRITIDAIAAEYRRYQGLGEGAMSQMSDAELVAPAPGDANSAATIVWHLAGNFQSRFTDFLTSDGEKPWRKRDEEFDLRMASRAEILRRWNEGWTVLFATLAGLDDTQLDRSVSIRAQPLSVREALLRSVTHTSYHVGQMVLLARGCRGAAWKSLSIPRGQSQAYNQAPTRERSM